MQEEFNEARVYLRKGASAGEPSVAGVDSGGRQPPEVRLASVTFALRPFLADSPPESQQESIAWITGRVSVFFGHAPQVTIERNGIALLVLDAGPFPLRAEFEAFATAIAIEAAHIGMDCACTASSRDGGHFRMVAGELMPLDD
jgi:hypothetical protein